MYHAPCLHPKMNGCMVICLPRTNTLFKTMSPFCTILGPILFPFFVALHKGFRYEYQMMAVNIHGSDSLQIEEWQFRQIGSKHGFKNIKENSKIKETRKGFNNI